MKLQVITKKDCLLSLDIMILSEKKRRLILFLQNSKSLILGGIPGIFTSRKDIWRENCENYLGTFTGFSN